MTEPSADRKVRTAWKIPGIDLGWLSRSVSWKTILITLAVMGAAASLIVVSGVVSISADKPDGWLAEHLLHFVFKRSVASRSNGLSPPADLAAASRVRLGAQQFDMVCANCHGRPGFGQSVEALSMSPRPQDLARVVGQFSDPELYVIVQHGVKYSAMPSWPTDARGDEIWSMVAFLRRLPGLDAKAYREMTALPAKPAGAPPDWDGDAALRPADPRRNTPPRDEFVYAAPAAGFSDQTVHVDPAATCARCHGADGSGAATGGEAPNLTIQNAAYLRAALDAYTSGARKSGFMQEIAAELSAAQVAALADYYAGLPTQSVAAPQAAPALVERGRIIATEGLRDRAIPACAMCHESDGGKIAGAPHIAGQSETYLRRELGAMRRGGRGSTGMWNPMPAEAHDLSDKDIAALAAYYSGLKPAKASGADSMAGASQAAHWMGPAAGDVSAAKQIFETRCMKCHVNGGRGDLEGDYPNLTVHAGPYVAQSLYAFRTGARLNSKMQGVTDGLSLDQIASLATYVNSLAPQRAAARPAPDAAQIGAAIATKGIPARGVPACLSCHDAKGIAALPLIPPLQGQSAPYLRHRLARFARPYANISALNPMPSIASRLTDAERASLAAYFAAAAPLAKPAARP